MHASDVHTALLLERLVKEQTQTNHLLDQLIAQVEAMGSEHARLVEALLEAVSEEEDDPMNYLDRRPE